MAAGLNDENANEIAEEGPYFFHGRGYGTDATAGPFDVLLNKGFATAQWEGKGRNLFTYPYGFDRTLRAITHPNEAMQNSGGWRRTLRVHVVPGSREGWSTWAWVPNYYGHVLEGGIAYRRLREWAAYQGIPYPAVFAGVSTWASAFMNEAYEDPDPGPSYGGTTLDLLFFDLGAIFLFEYDPVARFFAKNLRASVWPTQAALRLNDGELINNGHHLVMKLPLPRVESFSFFIKGGLGFMGGFAFHRDNGIDINVGAGWESKKRFIDPATRLETSEFGPAGGIWVDRRGTLLGSLLIEPHTDRYIALNIYPGVAPFLGDFGAWVAFNSDGRPSVGLSHPLGMGLGAAFSF